MDGVLKLSTAVTIKLGPFLDDTDGKTAEIALTIAQADVRLSKNAGAMAQKGSITAATHDALGMYDCPLSTADVGSLGILGVNVAMAGALPIKQTYMIMAAASYDVMYGAGVWSVNLAFNIVPKKNTALANFPFVMFDSTTGDPKTGLVVTATRSIDGGVFGAAANAVVEVANGAYKISLAATDTNGDVIILRFAATGAKDQLVSLITQP